MRPSFTNKNGARYRFYVSTRHCCGGARTPLDRSGGIAAPEIETLIEAAIRERTGQAEQEKLKVSIFERVDRVVLKASSIEVTADVSKKIRVSAVVKTFEIARISKAKPDVTRLELTEAGKPDQKLIQSIVRAHVWLRELSSGKIPVN